MSVLTVALVQQAWCGDAARMRERLSAAIAEAAARGAELVCLPELHDGPYFCQGLGVERCDLAAPIPGPATAFYGALAREHRVVIVASLFERRAPGLYHNTAAVLERDGSLAGIYRKMHIPHDPGFEEKFYFAPGDLGFVPIDCSLGRLGVLVCWDQWFPEAARLMALAGAELLIYPTAIGANPEDDPAEQERQRQAWITVQRGHAIANNLPLLAINRCGFEPHPQGQGPGIRFWGASFACGPQGEILAEAGEQPTLLVARLDRQRCEAVRRWWPFLRDRRIDAYGDLLRRWRDPPR
ncbi:MAG: carbon-nitrogen hydrolase [Planctomycetota bacterium]|nr:carbon-nitrogen hydrolase [Planctomycetota bacterium]MCX8040333.1 carbon-nitrogen hydrolase [Planctomycetota bacterium]MDW8373789.1 carbon-nitrogen hydrolase [Planctomycetota bacterium]